MPAYYSAPVEAFLAASKTDVHSQLTTAYEQDRFNSLFMAQYTVWRDVIGSLQEILGAAVANIGGVPIHVLLEFWVPRRLSRIDAVILLADIVLVLEFKTEPEIDSLAQAEDYALDLALFHEPSRDRDIYPIVVGGHRRIERSGEAFFRVQPGRIVPANQLCEDLKAIALRATGTPINAQDWDGGQYHPVPTIIEAAQAMFSEMEVDEIAHADADPKNLGATIDCLTKLILEAKKSSPRKLFVAVTGVPGAGKTLAGLKLVHAPHISELTGSSFLSGNGPLVKVLREALIQDRRKRVAEQVMDASEREDLNKVQVLREDLRLLRHKAETQIQGVLSFKKAMIGSVHPPVEHVIVFDEAQRAWTAARNAEVLGRHGSKDVEESEPELLLSILDRHDWAVLVALIGGGQEIHKGEAGLEEWGRALAERFRNWTIACSPEALNGGPSTAGKSLFAPEQRRCLTALITQHSELHLDTPTRQFRGKTIASWSNALLSGQRAEARTALQQSPEYPLYLTRNLADARDWLRERTRGTQHCGLVASSSSVRLRAYGIETDGSFHKGIPIHHWFLSELPDVRSSNKLEVAATEFEIQGLELDWVGVCWGPDFVYDAGASGWVERTFVRGQRWKPIGSSYEQESDNSRIKREYLRNSYRVLLTRARLGMIIFVPIGADDASLPKIALDETYKFLRECGARDLKK